MRTSVVLVTLLVLNGSCLIGLPPLGSFAIGAGKLAIMSVYREHQIKQRERGTASSDDAVPQDRREIREWSEVTDTINENAFRYIARMMWAGFCLLLVNVLAIAYLIYLQRFGQRNKGSGAPKASS